MNLPENISPDRFLKNFDRSIINDRFEIFKSLKKETRSRFSEDVRKGLSSKKKFLLPKYFYDDKGSELFEKICTTDEYYPTRTEKRILLERSDEISLKNKKIRTITELGSGSSEKSELLINSFLKDRNFLHYIPIDVSPVLMDSSESLLKKFNNLNVSGIISFYENGIKLISHIDSSPKLILFLGSSIGNFTRKDSVEFLKMVRQSMNPDERFMVGFDLEKDTEVLNRAYNDSKGYTAAFNLNILERINRELGGDFDLKKFSHKAFYNSGKMRMEMHLISGEDMKVWIDEPGYEISFKKGETIHTENSCKFTFESIADLADKSGLAVSDHYTDTENYFTLTSLTVKK